MVSRFSPTNQRRLAQLERGKTQLLQKALRHGASCVLIFEMKVDDGTLQGICRKRSRIKTLKGSDPQDTFVANRAKLAELAATEKELLDEGLTRGFFGKLIIEVTVDNGLITEILPNQELYDR